MMSPGEAPSFATSVGTINRFDAHREAVDPTTRRTNALFNEFRCDHDPRRFDPTAVKVIVQPGR